MANEHKLPDGDPESDIAHIKRLSIYATSDGLLPTRRLDFHIQGFTDADENGEGGTPIPAGSAPDQWIEEFLKSDELPPRLVPSPLDFSLEKKCFVVLKLLGDFWEFSPLRDGVTTKDKHGDDRYYRLRAYVLRHGKLSPAQPGDKVRCVCFCARQPLPPGSGGDYVRHGINLYVDFVSGADSVLRLPVIIDPDVENKGGNP